MASWGFRMLRTPGSSEQQSEIIHGIRVVLLYSFSIPLHGFDGILGHTFAVFVQDPKPNCPAARPCSADLRIQFAASFKSGHAQALDVHDGKIMLALSIALFGREAQPFRRPLRYPPERLGP